MQTGSENVVQIPADRCDKIYRCAMSYKWIVDVGVGTAMQRTQANDTQKKDV